MAYSKAPRKKERLRVEGDQLYSFWNWKKTNCGVLERNKKARRSINCAILFVDYEVKFGKGVSWSRLQTYNKVLTQ